MDTRIVQFDRQDLGESSQQKMESRLGPEVQFIKAPIISRRAFFAAMLALLAEEFRQGQSRRNSPTSV